MIWVEVLSRHGDVVARHRLAGSEVSIGRGYDNDVVLEDPYVAARHLSILRDENGALVAECREGAGAIVAERPHAAAQRLVLDGDRPFRIGRTTLRVREASFAVAPPRALPTGRRLWPVILALAVAVLALQGFGRWIGDHGETKPSVYAIALLAVMLAATGWCMVWSIVSRVYSGQARFERHLLVALAGLCAYALYDGLVDALPFALSWNIVETYGYIGIWVILAVVCGLHLWVIGPARMALKGGAVAALAGIALAIQTIGLSEVDGGSKPVSRLMPPALRLSGLSDEAAFFADIERLKARLDRDRVEAPTDRDTEFDAE